MNQQNYQGDTLLLHWMNILKQGVAHSPYAQTDLNQLDIEMPFYGDLMNLHHQENTLDLNTFLPKSWLNFPLPLRRSEPKTLEHSEFIPFLPQHSVSRNLPISERLSLYSALSKDIILKEFSVLLNYFPKLHAQLIHQFLIETYLYLSNECFMREVHARIMRCLPANEELIIVAHSLGSVVAYNLLYQHTELNVKRFITLGSPLAFRVIQDKILHPIIRPECIHGDWINFYSRDDFLTAFPLSNAPFDFKPAIINTMITTFAREPHRIVGYLQHPDVVDAIMSAALKR